jgi:hypothetical protein
MPNPRQRYIYPKASTLDLIKDQPGKAPFDFDVPSPLSQAISRRLVEQQQADYKAQDMKLSPLDRAIAGLESAMTMGSMMFEAIQQAPKLLQGEDAYATAIGNRIYQPRMHPEKSAEYIGDVIDLMDKAQTEYKLPPILPEVAGFAPLMQAANKQVKQGVNQAATQSGMALERSLDKPVTNIMNRGGFGAQMLGSFDTQPAQVVKPKGGNWETGAVEKALSSLKRNKQAAGSLEEMRSVYPPEVLEMLSPETRETVTRAFPHLEKEVALNNWVDRNLTNYVKKEMGTPEDPVRRLAEEGISHIPAEDLRNEANWLPERLEDIRRKQGYPGAGMANSPEAQGWEIKTDTAIEPTDVGAMRDMSHLLKKDITEPWMANVDPATKVYMPNDDMHGRYLGFDHIIDVLRQDVAEGRIRPDQLSKVSMEQAVRRTAEFDQEQARKMAEAQIKATEGMPVYKEYPEGYKWIELAAPEGNKFEESIRHLESNPKEWQKAVEEFRENRQKNLESALKYEGDTMGHCVGGYCPDVLEGRSRIYSLRDARGEPHVTVEVIPGEITPLDLPKDLYEEYRNQMAQGISAHGGRPGATEWLRHFHPDVAKQIIPPESIKQIKGKQNAAPKEDYLPFVQDFVRSGEWSDVGDLKNTGLIKQEGKYLTQAEVDDELLRQLQPPPVEGMKAGGSVHISDNPDTMAMELEDHNFAGGGIAKKIISKLARAPAKSAEEIRAIAQRMAPQITGEEFVRGSKGTKSIAEKTQKQFAREKEIQHDIRPTGAVRPPEQTVDMEKLKGNVMIGIPGDPTISDQTIHSVAGRELVVPSPQHGGPLYGLGRDDAFWASGLGAANRVQNLAREAGQQYDAPVLGNYVMMGPDSYSFAQHFADANLQNIRPNEMTKSQIKGFNEMVKKGYPYKDSQGVMRQRVFPAFPGIENPEDVYLHMSIDPDLRKHFGNLMQMPTVTEKYNLPSGLDVAHAATVPSLRNLEIGVTGKSIGRMKPEVEELKLSTHPTYSHDIPGEYIGGTEHPVPYELMFPDTVKSVRENPRQAGQEFGSFKMVGPRQIIDPQLIDELGLYRDFIKQYTGKKDGGLIKVKRKAIKKVVKAKSKATEAPANKPVTAPKEALKYAEGGAITGDDLILTERPL